MILIFRSISHIILPFLLLLHLALADDNSIFKPVNHPNISFNQIGNRIGLFGLFEALSFYSYSNASQNLHSPFSSTLHKRDTTASESSGLFIQDPSNNNNLQISSINGQINQINTISNNSLIINGNFTQINDQQVKSPIIFDTNSYEITEILSNNTRGVINTYLIDDDLVYLGGDFEFNQTYGAAVYNITSKVMSSTKFQGFGNDSIINSIYKLNDSIVFGGKFNTLGLSDLLLHNITTNTTSNQTNSSIVSAEQLISLKHASFTSVNGLGDNSQVICPSSDYEWEAQQSSGAEWRVELPDEMKGITPTKARIYIPDSTNGIKLFRIYSYPNNGIMNLTYIDPNTNELAYCDAWCPLIQSDNLQDIIDGNVDNSTDLNQDDVFVDSDGSYFKYYDPTTKTKNLGYGANFQEFAFINQVGIDSIGLTIVDWFGAQGVFSGFELYQNAITIFGNDTLNEPNCGDENTENYAVIESGNFSSILDSHSDLNTNYLVSSDTDAKISLYPNISYSGNYSIIMTTPGCSYDNTCDQRSIVNVTIISDDEIVSSNLIYQNNENDKFDYLFYGHLKGSTQDGSNKIEISYHDKISDSSSIMVVDKVTANIVSLDSYYDRNNTNATRSKYEIKPIKLNGLFEYSLDNFTNFDESRNYNSSTISLNNTFIGNSSINLLSGSFDNDTVVDQIISHDSLYLLGQFESKNFTIYNKNLITLNISSYSHNQTNINLPSSLKKREKFIGGTFNNSISRIISLSNGILTLGDFSVEGEIKDLSNNNNSVSSANNIAYYSNEQWFSFGNEYINRDINQFANFTVNNTEYFTFSSNDFFKVWDNTNFRWTNDSFNVSQAVNINKDQQLLGGQSFSNMDIYSKNQAYIKENNKFDTYNIDLYSSVSSSFYINSSMSIIGGNFESNDSKIKNVGLISNDSVSSLQGNINWSDDAFIESIYVDNNQHYLFMGVNGSVEIESSVNVTGIVIYDLQNNTFASFQPSELSNSDGSPINVNSLVLYDEGNQLLVGGNFDTAGSLSCPSLCVYDLSNTRWINPQSGDDSKSISGTVTDMKFYQDSNVLISGTNLTLSNNPVSFLTYDFNSQSFNTKSSLNSLNKNVDRFIINDNSNSDLQGRMVAYGDSFISGFDGNNWSDIANEIEFDDNSVFRDLKLLKLDKSSKTNYNQTYFNNDDVLSVCGVFQLKNYGLVNMALYNGSTWIPYVYTSENSTTLGSINTILIDDRFRFQSSDDLKKLTSNLSKGKVVGISLACALGATALFGLFYVIPFLLLFKRRDKSQRNHYSEANQRIYENDMIDAVNPEDLLHEIDLQREK